MIDRSEIVITGVGLATPVGESATATWAALLAGASIRDHSRALASSLRTGENWGEGGNVQTPTGIGSQKRLRLGSTCGIRRTAIRPSSQPSPRWGEGAAVSALERLIELGTRVTREALGDRDWSNDPRTTLVVGTSKGPADDWLVPVDSRAMPVVVRPDEFAQQPAREISRRPTSDNPSKPKCEDVTPGPFIPTCEDVAVAPDIRPVSNVSIISTPEYGLAVLQTALAKQLGIAGPRLTLSAACASSLHALIRATMMLQLGEADRVIVVGVESSLHPAFIESFKRLGVIANPGEPCRPMDRRRSGFLISEAAAAICLERRKATAGQIIIDGYAIGSDASHLTHTDANAGTLKHCLQSVVTARPVDLIHAHATGTVSNDVIELNAIDSVLNSADCSLQRPVNPPTIYSHKGAIGHSLGASGLVSTALNVLSHQTGIVPGNIHTHEPLPTRAGTIGYDATTRVIRRSMVIAAGFGGATGVVGLKTTE